MQVVITLEEYDQDLNINSSIPLGVYPNIDDVLLVLKEEGFTQSPKNSLHWGLPSSMNIKETCATFVKVSLVEKENYDLKTLIKKFSSCIEKSK